MTRLGRFIVSIILSSFVLANTFGQSVVRDLIYQKQGGAAFTMDVFKPAKPNGAGVIWIVSGGWFSHHEDINLQLAQFLNAQGFTVFEVVHGSQPKYIIPEILGLLTHAIRFIHVNAASYGVDPSRLGLAGASAGGHLSLMLAGAGDSGDPNAKDPVERAPSTVKAVVAYFPPTDFLNYGGEGKLPFSRTEMTIYMPAFGISPTTPIETLMKIGKEDSPIYRVTSSFPPTLLIHGDKDALVPIQQSQIMDAAFQKFGVTHKLVVIPSGGHDAITMIGGAADFMKWFQVKL